jgi:GntR family transcriptional regulator, transcriptional repressor for pyruvate dehydrogenase complex
MPVYLYDSSDVPVKCTLGLTNFLISRSDMLNKVERSTTMTTRVVESLINFIWTSNLRPGDSLPSAEKLQETLGVSRPVIREALKILEGRNIVEAINGKGTILRDTDQTTLADFFCHAVQIRPKSTLELMEVRRGIEVQSVVLAAQRRTDQQALAIQGTVQEMEKNIANLAQYATLDMRLHLQIAEASQNSMLFFLVDSLREALEKSVIEGMRQRHTEEAHARVQELHKLLADAVVARDGDRAAEIMSAHFEEAIAALSRAN